MGFKIFKEIMGEELFEQKVAEADEVNVEHRFHLQFYGDVRALVARFLEFSE